MDIRGLLYFISAAERLNFTSAARECYITQTAMSLHIGKMEDELGFKLFTRNKKAVELTEAGKDFYKRARGIIEHYERSVRCSASIAGGMRGILNVVIPSCMEGFVFMEKFREFRSLYPEVELNILVQPHSALIETIKSGRADVGMGAPEDMELDPDFYVRSVREDPAVIVCSVSHPLAGLRKVTAEQLRNETILLSVPESMPQTATSFRNSGAKFGIEKNPILSVNNMDELLLMISLERGISFLPSFATARIYPKSAGIAFVECEIDGVVPLLTTAVGYLKDNQNPVLEHFLDVLLETG